MCFSDKQKAALFYEPFSFFRVTNSTASQITQTEDLRGGDKSYLTK